MSNETPFYERFDDKEIGVATDTLKDAIFDKYPPPIRRCPCGKIPEKIHVATGQGHKWAYAVGSCCGEWHIEFRTHYKEIDSAECQELAIKAWNSAPRGK